MTKSPAYDGVEELISRLDSFIKETISKTVSDDDYVIDNANFFSKSFLVMLCAYLEGYIKEVVAFHVAHHEELLKQAKLPNNLLRWSILKNKFKVPDENNFDLFSLNISDSEIDKNVSANPYTITPFFCRLGIKLDEKEEYTDLAEKVETIVNLRNSIIHHNDDASGLTLGDILDNSSTVLKYINAIDKEVCSSTI